MSSSPIQSWWLLILVAIIAVPVWAAVPEYQFNKWETDEGLPQSTVTSIAQTHDGYLWLGTQNGLVRFDGVNFKVFNRNNTPAIKNDRLVQLFEDRSGTLWVSGEDGELVSLRDGRFEYRQVPGKGTPFNYARRMCDDAEGALWFVSCEWQLLRLRDGKFDQPVTDAELQSGQPDAVASDPASGIWIHTDRGLGRWQTGKFAYLSSETNEGNFHVEIATGRSNSVWVAANQRLRNFKSDRWVADEGSFAWANLPIYDLYEDRHGQIWVATMGGGLFRYGPDGSVLHLTRQDGLPSDFVRCITEDREGNLWVGMENGGVCRMRAITFRSPGVRQNLSSEHVTAVSESREGSFWIATDGDGLDELAPDGQVHHYGAEQGLMNGHVWTVLDDHQGNVWAGTWDGLYRRSGAGQFTNLSDGLTIGRQIFALYQDRQNDIWLGQQGSGALTRIHGDERTVVRIPNSSPSLDVRVMTQDAEGNFWVGTENDGLYCLQGDHWTHFGEAEGLRSQTVWSLRPDEDGSLWIGTCGGGLSRLKNGRISTWTTKDGLVNDVICQILEDDHNNLWLGSYGGVFRIGKSDLTSASAGKTVHCIAYDTSDGLPSIQCVGSCQPSGLKSHDGHLWFPTVKGYAIIDPQAVPRNFLSPPVIIEDFAADGVPQLPRANSAAGGEPRAAIEILPGHQRYAFRYTALSLTNPGKVRFKYRLEGIESDWNEAGAKRIAEYSYLPPGRYQFHVIACNNDGVWNETGSSLAIVLLPHFWQTKWFLLLTIATAIGIVATSVRFVVKRKMQRKIELIERERAIEAERRRIANNIHDDLGAGLTEIVILSELAQSPAESQAAVQTDIRTVTDKARALTHSLDEIVWAVNPENDTLDSFVSYACNFAQNYLQSCRIRCRLAVPANIPNVPLTTDARHNLFMVLKEALNNVVKHAAASEVFIQITLESDKFVLTVKDNGKGFQPNPASDGVATPTADNAASGSQSRRRNGLTNMRKRVNALHGQFTVQSQPGQGTQIELTMNFHHREATV